MRTVFRPSQVINQILLRENPRANPIVQEYILPDFSLNRRGRVRGPDEIMLDAYQVLYMNNERFSVPEILFRPDDIGKSAYLLYILTLIVSPRAGAGRPPTDYRTQHLSATRGSPWNVLGQHRSRRRFSKVPRV